MLLLLKRTIQVFWIMVGSMSLWLIVECLWRVLTGQAPNGAFEWVVAVPMLALFGTFVFGAWRACFRFLPDTIRNTVFLISLFLFSLAQRGFEVYFEPWLEPKGHVAGSLSPVIALVLLFVIIAGAIKYYRVTSSTLTRFLFPELNRSGIQAL